VDAVAAVLQTEAAAKVMEQDGVRAETLVIPVAPS
jgi:hypothetical protein